MGILTLHPSYMTIPTSHACQMGSLPLPPEKSPWVTIFTSHPPHMGILTSCPPCMIIPTLCACQMVSPPLCPENHPMCMTDGVSSTTPEKSSCMVISTLSGHSHLASTLCAPLHEKIISFTSCRKIPKKVRKQPPIPSIR